MGDMRPYFQIISFCLSIFVFSPVLSRTLEPIPKPSSVLDVGASIRRSAEILSFNPDMLQQQQEQDELLKQSNSSSFTVKLYSRDILSRTRFKTYRDLALSRLQRDSFRMDFLHQKLDVALGRNLTSDINTMNAKVPLTAGLGEYFAPLGIGTPPQQVYTAIDTGSDVSWVPCAPCTDCNEQVDPIFRPSESSSYKPLMCNSQQCDELEERACNTRANTCIYGVLYGSGLTVGEFATESLSFGSSAFDTFAIGCGHYNQHVFGGKGGLLGLGHRSLSFPSQTKMFSFSYCLADRDSTEESSTLDFGSLVIPNEAITAPLLRNPAAPDTFYYVGLTGVSVDGKMIRPASAFAIQANGYGGVIVDSGTTITRFFPEVYNVLRDEFVKATKGLQAVVTPSNVLDTCFDLTSRTSDEVTFPVVAFHFDTKTLILPAKNTVIPHGNNMFCLAFATIDPTEGPMTIGNVQQQQMLVSFDVGRSAISFTPEKC